MASENKEVISPSYYKTTNGFQVADLTDDLNFNLGNVIKYVSRAGKKSNNIKEDLTKALWYLTREISKYE